MQMTDLEKGLSRLLRLAGERQLPGMARADQQDGPTLQVVDRVMATVRDPVTLALACPNDQKVLLMDISPDLYFETEEQVGRDVMLIRLDRIGDEELSLRLHDAWEFVAPDKLKRLVD